jgi:NADH dehydrogenase (ubiquinone) Fe-S protein 4
VSKTSPSTALQEVQHAEFENHNVSVISGAPENLKLRTARIYRPAKTAMQSGLDNTRFWKMDWNADARWENPLMGWVSSGGM